MTAENSSKTYYERVQNAGDWGLLPPGSKVTKSAVLFSRLTD